MAEKQQISVPQSGMNRDKHPSTLQRTEYPFALNANVESEDGSIMMLQNEPSNLLCKRFDGDKVIGYKNDLDTGETYFFLTNPETKVSKVATLKSQEYVFSVEDIQSGTDVDVMRMLADPLETSPDRYNEICGAINILIEDDEENPCLNFNICHPIYTIEIKTEKCGKCIYWTDGFNPPRYLNIERLLNLTDEERAAGVQSWYHYEGEIFCGDYSKITPVKIACDKLRIFPLRQRPCINVATTEYGGQLRAGTYEFCIALCDAFGNEISNYYSLTNPITIFDPNDSVVRNGIWGANTGYGIRLDVENIDSQADYYKVCVIQYTVGSGGTTVPVEDYFIEGVHPITEKTIYYLTDQNQERTTLTHLAMVKQVYKTAKGLTTSGRRLLMYGLTAENEWNLQPIANLLGGFLQWQTVAGKEELYKDGVNVSKYASYMRDEVYPFSIRFVTSEGYDTALFPLIPRPAIDFKMGEKTLNEKLQIVKEDGSFDEAFQDERQCEVQSILENTPNCSANERNELWQFYNTATIEGEETEVEKPLDECENVIRSIEEKDAMFTFLYEQQFHLKIDGLDYGTDEDTVAYVLNVNKNKICSNANGTYIEQLCEYLKGAGIDGTADVNFGDNCEEPSLKERTVSIQGVDYKNLKVAYKAEKDYKPYPFGELCDEEKDIDPMTSSQFSSIFYGSEYDKQLKAFEDYLYKDSGCDEVEGNPFGDIESRSGGYLGKALSFTNVSLTQEEAFELNAPVENHEELSICLKRYWANCNYGDLIIYESGGEDDNKDVIKWMKVFVKYQTGLRFVENYAVDDVFKQLSSCAVYSSDDSCLMGSSSPSCMYDTQVSTELERNPDNIEHDWNISGLSNMVAYSQTQMYHKQLSKSAQWIRIDRPTLFDNEKISDDKKFYFLELGFCPTTDIRYPYKDISDSFRVTFFKTKKGEIWKNPIISYQQKGYINDNGNSVFIKISPELFKDGTETLSYCYMAVDTKMVVASLYNVLGSKHFTCGSLNYGPAIGINAMFSAALPGCLGLTYRGREIEGLEMDLESVNLRVEDTYTAFCRICNDKETNCGVTPYQYGNFGYWESTEFYPQNKELYDSSDINVASSYEVYANLSKWYGMSGSKIGEKGNLCGQPIRHYRFPDGTLCPFMSGAYLPKSAYTTIYPIGLRLDDKVVSQFLDIAVDNGLLTTEQRGRIVGYEIYRGDRRLNRSVIATGLAYDMMMYTKGSGNQKKNVYYPNYPYNDLHEDKYIYASSSRTKLLPHPYDGQRNNKYSFLSPDYAYRISELPTEIKFEGWQTGYAVGMFPDVINHSKWIILGPVCNAWVQILATAGTAISTASAIGESFMTGNLITGFITLAGNLAQVWIDHINNTYSWQQMFENFGPLSQFAFYYTSHGFYNRYESNKQAGNVLRGVASSRFIRSGNISLVNEGASDETTIQINNRDREESLFLALGNFFYTYIGTGLLNFDDSRVTPYCDKINVKGRIEYDNSMSSRSYFNAIEVDSSIASPYFRLKRYYPNQYGGIENIRWLPVGHCANMNEEDSIRRIFGGDIYISRHSLKRKFEFFTQNAIGLANDIPWAYSEYSNVGYTRYYADYKSTDAYFLSKKKGIQMPWQDTQSEFACRGTIKDQRKYLEGKFFLFSYGIPEFLVESEINCNYRLSPEDFKNSFYPLVSDYERWTQEVSVPIATPNVYMYNGIYNNVGHTLAIRMLPGTFESKFYNCVYQLPNGVIWSREDASERSQVDPWLMFKPLDYFEFPAKNGDVVHLRGIESEQVLCRFQNQVALYNAIDVLKERVTAKNADLGTGGLFASRPVEYNNTDLGYSGSQSVEMVSNEFGHYWVDVKRAQVFSTLPNGKGLKEVSTGIRHWLKENLPFKILKYEITSVSTGEPMTYSDVDNKFTGLGLSLGWDNRFKRLFITKKDYVPVKPASSYTYQDCKFYCDGQEVKLTDPNYFEDVSFTLAYHVLKEEWISYYSFKPDYYIEHQAYFQTGINYSADENELGLWSHLLTNQSFQVFYGKLYPFLIEVPEMGQYTKKVLTYIQYEMDCRRYQTEVDFAQNRLMGFNKLWIYNQLNNTGELRLVPQDKNNLSQILTYPVQGPTYREILATEIETRWKINDFFNQVKRDTNNIPIWTKDKNDIWKDINIDAIYYDSIWKDRLRGDWFIMRLDNDVESRYRMIVKWVFGVDDYYNA